MATGDVTRSTVQDAWYTAQRKLDPYAEYILLGVPVLWLLAVLGFPVALNVYASFFAWNGTGWPTDFVGLANYAAILDQPALVNSIVNTFIWTVGMVVIPPMLGLGLALLVEGIRGQSLIKTLFFLPYPVSLVAVGIMWKFMYQGRWGVVNTVLSVLGYEELTRAWLGVIGLNTYAMMIANGWIVTAFAMVIYIAGLQSIPPHLIEASKIDGLSRFQRFRYVTLPLLRPFTTLVVATTLFNVLKVFSIIWVMTGGGPHFTSETLAVAMYRVAFVQFQFGQGAALANVLTLIVIVVTVVYIQSNIRKEVEY